MKMVPSRDASDVLLGWPSEDQPLVASAKERHATRLSCQPSAPLRTYSLPSRLISHDHFFSTPLLHTICVAHSRSITSTTPINTMCSKRKRSVDDSPLSSYGAFSTPEAQSPIPFPQTFHGSMDMDVDTCSRPSGWDFASASRVKNTDWGHRTRKRVRDNRPDERSIHRMFLHNLTKPVLNPNNS
jgi:hypothetical protein